LRKAEKAGFIKIKSILTFYPFLGFSGMLVLGLDASTQTFWVNKEIDYQLNNFSSGHRVFAVG